MTLLNLTNQEPINYGSCTNTLRKSGWKIIIWKSKHWLRVMNWSTSHVALVMKNSNNNVSSHSCLGCGSQDMNRSKILNLHKVVYSVFYSNSNASQVSFRQDVLIIVSSWIFLVLARHNLSFDILKYNIEHYFRPRSFFISDSSNESSN